VDACSYHKQPPPYAVGMQRCVASPGDIMYIPNLQERATCNIDDWVFAVGWHGGVTDTPMAIQAVLDDDEASLRALPLLDKLRISPRTFDTHAMTKQVEKPEGPVHIAAVTGSVRMLRALQDLGHDLHENTRSIGTPLHTAAGWGHVAACDFLVKNGLIHPDVLQSETLSTPLHYAAAIGHTAVVRWLLEKPGSHHHTMSKDGGANRRLKSNVGQTALHFAAANGHKDIVDMLISGRQGRQLLQDAEVMAEVEELAKDAGRGAVLRRLQDARRLHGNSDPLEDDWGDEDEEEPLLEV